MFKLITELMVNNFSEVTMAYKHHNGRKSVFLFALFR